MEDNLEHFKDNPEEIYRQTQLDMLNELEGHHDTKPDKAALVISVSLSVIEAAVAYLMVASAGVFIASIVALFPVALLWAIANYHADKVEVTEAYDELTKTYHNAQQ